MGYLLKLLSIFLIILTGCNSQNFGQCEYTYLDTSNELECISIPARKYNFIGDRINSGAGIGGICKGYQQEWAYYTDTELIQETLENGSYLGNEFNFMTSDYKVMDYTCYYSVSY